LRNALDAVAREPLVVLAGVVVVAGVAFALARGLPADGPPGTPYADGRPLPGQVGGTLNVEGDRTGAMVLDRMQQEPTFDDSDPDTVSVRLGPLRLTGDGQVTISRDPEEGVTQVSYDGLSFYPKPGDCSLVEGPHNPEYALVTATLECEALEDIRGNGTVSLRGDVALPADLFGARGSIPPSGGSLVADSTTVTFPDAVTLVGPSVIAFTGRTPTPVGGGEPPTILGVEHEAEGGGWFLTSIQTGSVFAGDPAGCRLGVEQLGKLGPQAVAVRLKFDCDLESDGEASVSVQGELVVDVYEQAS
jgi:hypothetical protein